VYGTQNGDHEEAAEPARDLAQIPGKDHRDISPGRALHEAHAVRVLVLRSLKEVAHEPPVAKRCSDRGIGGREQLRRALTRVDR
jgi:hypothetical protein